MLNILTTYTHTKISMLFYEVKQVHSINKFNGNLFEYFSSFKNAFSLHITQRYNIKKTLFFKDNPKANSENLKLSK